MSAYGGNPHAGKTKGVELVLTCASKRCSETMNVLCTEREVEKITSKKWFCKAHRRHGR